MSIRRKILYFDNPVAGRETGLREQALILEALLQEGDALTIWRSRSENDFMQIADASPENYDLLVSNGGDGTLNLVVGGLQGYLRHHPGLELPPLLYVPTGSTCDFARSLRLSPDPVMAVRDAFHGEDRLFDLGMLRNCDIKPPADRALRPFVYIAAFGAFIEASFGTRREWKNVLGRLAYFIEGIRLVTGIESKRVRVTWDDGQMEDEFIFGGFINSHFVGGILEFRDDITDLSDGEFELLLIRKAKNHFQYAELAAKLLNRNFDHELCFLTHCRKVRFDFYEPTSFTVDGEFGGKSAGWELYVQKEGLKLRIPPQVI